MVLFAGGPDIGFGTWHQRQWCLLYARLVARPYEAADIVFLGIVNGVPSHVGLASGQGTILESTLRGNLDGVVETPDTDPIWNGVRVEAWRIPEWSE